MAKKNEVAATSSGLPAELAEEMALDAGDGTQDITNEDMAIPFLRILQKMSPQLSKRDGAYIEGADEGDIYNTVTGKIYKGDEGVIVVPSGFNFKVIEWVPREKGGGIVNSYPRGSELPSSEKDDRGRRITGDGHTLEDTAEHFVLILDEQHDSLEQALVACSSTQLKHSRKWSSMIKQKTVATPEGVKPAPSYGYSYRLKTGTESNEHGDWSNWIITDEGPLQDVNVYRAGKAFASTVSQGAGMVKHTQDDDVPF